MESINVIFRLLKAVAFVVHIVVVAFVVVNVVVLALFVITGPIIFSSGQ